MKEFAKGTAIPQSVVDTSCMQLCLLLLFEELYLSELCKTIRRYNNSAAKKHYRYMVAIQLHVPMMYLKMNGRDIKKIVEQPNSTEPIQ